VNGICLNNKIIFVLLVISLLKQLCVCQYAYIYIISGRNIIILFVFLPSPLFFFIFFLPAGCLLGLPDYTRLLYYQVLFNILNVGPSYWHRNSTIKIILIMLIKFFLYMYFLLFTPLLTLSAALAHWHTPRPDVDAVPNSKSLHNTKYISY